MKSREKLLKHITKNEMVPTFVSGIFPSCAINILTNESSRSNLLEMLSMGLMLITSFLLFYEASKIHELQTWFANLPELNQTDDNFLEHSTVWNFRECKGFHKKALPLATFTSWITGLFSLLIYFFSSYMEQITRCIINGVNTWINT